MNTSMADGARERLVAQIGEALFGQPGLTLMELAEKVKVITAEKAQAAKADRQPGEHRWDDVGERCLDCGDKDWMGGPCSGPRQPSPAGQVDALVTDQMVMAALQAVTRETLADVGDCDSKVIGVLTAYGVDGAVHIPTMVRAMLEAALAARQPVASASANHRTALLAEERAHGETIGQRDRYHEMADELASHIAHITGADIGEHNSANCPWQNAIDAAEAYQPAQTVDLAEFKALYRAYVRLLESGLDRINDLGGSCDPVDVMEANDLDLQAARRVIDGKAVGNG